MTNIFQFARMQNVDVKLLCNDGNDVKDEIFQLVTQAYSEKKKFRVLPTGVEPMTFRLVLRMLYH